MKTLFPEERSVAVSKRTLCACRVNTKSWKIDCNYERFVNKKRSEWLARKVGSSRPREPGCIAESHFRFAGFAGCIQTVRASLARFPLIEKLPGKSRVRPQPAAGWPIQNYSLYVSILMNRSALLPPFSTLPTRTFRLFRNDGAASVPAHSS